MVSSGIMPDDTAGPEGDHPRGHRKGESKGEPKDATPADEAGPKDHGKELDQHSRGLDWWRDELKQVPRSSDLVQRAEVHVCFAESWAP